MNEGFFLKNGSYQFLNNKMIDDYVKTYDNNNLMEVDYCGMGFMLVKREFSKSLNIHGFNQKQANLHLVI